MSYEYRSLSSFCRISDIDYSYLSKLNNGTRKPNSQIVCFFLKEFPRSFPALVAKMETEDEDLSLRTVGHSERMYLVTLENHQD